ncbi:MAG: hypothetical protein ACOC3I_04125 [Verrucomicrobiota bacterium]
MSNDPRTHARATEESAETLAEDLSRVVEEAKAFASASWQDDRRRGRGAYKAGQAHAQNSFDAVRSSVEEARSQACTSIRRQPLAAVGLGLGVGLLVGAILGTCRHSR